MGSISTFIKNKYTVPPLNYKYLPKNLKPNISSLPETEEAVSSLSLLGPGGGRDSIISWAPGSWDTRLLARSPGGGQVSPVRH